MDNTKENNCKLVCEECGSKENELWHFTRANNDEVMVCEICREIEILESELFYIDEKYQEKYTE